MSQRQCNGMEKLTANSEMEGNITEMNGHEQEHFNSIEKRIIEDCNKETTSRKIQ